MNPSNERSLWGTAEDKRAQWKNYHVSTSIMPNPCLVHPLLWQGERAIVRDREEGQGGNDEAKREMKRNRGKIKAEKGKKRLREGKRDKSKKTKKIPSAHGR